MSRHVPPVNEVVFLHSVTKSVAGVAIAASAALALAACGSSSSSTPSGSGGGGSSSAPVPQISVSDLNNSFSAMTTPAERPYGPARGSKYSGQDVPTASRLYMDFVQQQQR